MFKPQCPLRVRVPVALTIAAAAITAQAGFITSITPYTVPVSADYDIIPLLSVGDRVPRTSNPAQQYQMVGVPDGLGACRNADGTVSVYMNHEVRNTVQT